MEDIKNEVEAPQAAAEKDGFWKDLWNNLILPALKSFWEKNSGEIIGALKSLGASLVKAIIEKIKGDKK